VRLSPLGKSASNWPIVPALDDGCVCVEQSDEWELAGETKVFSENLPPVPLCPPQIPHDRTCTSYDMALAKLHLSFCCCNNLKWFDDYVIFCMPNISVTHLVLPSVGSHLVELTYEVYQAVKSSMLLLLFAGVLLKCVWHRGHFPLECTVWLVPWCVQKQVSTAASASHNPSTRRSGLVYACL
jgi:hypothetical protein